MNFSKFLRTFLRKSEAVELVDVKMFFDKILELEGIQVCIMQFPTARGLKSIKFQQAFFILGSKIDQICAVRGIRKKLRCDRDRGTDRKDKNQDLTSSNIPNLSVPDLSSAPYLSFNPSVSKSKVV